MYVIKQMLQKLMPEKVVPEKVVSEKSCQKLSRRAKNVAPGKFVPKKSRDK